MTIRLAREGDSGQIREIYAPIVEATAISFETSPPDEAEMRERIRRTLAERPWLVCVEGEALLGYAYAAGHRAREAYRWSVECSVYVRSDARRRGIGRALYRSLFALLALQGYYNAYAGISLPNPASVALHEAVGFRPVGVYREVGFKAGRWRDVGWWELSLKPKGGTPVPPIGLTEASADPRWEVALRSGEPLLRGA